ncbi:PEPxxWA-CTERM sorting domain-containing protein [Sandarakinorhabdus sp.]|uniref:PEPxxWA-CTERM sorting domain-containing protein n=1 Tax=Sandarakinorhabdus sp. TaxID=1916663 RepID=UPI00286E3D0D|nr:PEPxxWA-CTERM sorting domain-containing protein [Sandarakinorhabdus sp.]
MSFRNLIIAGAFAATASMASAATVVLDFTGVVNPGLGNSTSVDNFYNGGVSGHGTSGTNYGAGFSANGLAINGYNGCCEPDQYLVPARKGILFFLSGGAVTVNYAAGFTTGFSFYYASNSNATIRVYDGLNGTGNVLASLALATQANQNCRPGATGFYCNWTPVGVAFAGTARSIDFGGGANFVAYDNITFGSDRPGGTVPEPSSWVMLIAGFGLVGAAMRRRKAALAA